MFKDEGDMGSSKMGSGSQNSALDQPWFYEIKLIFCCIKLKGYAFGQQKKLQCYA